MSENPVINTDLKRYDKKFIVEDNILWEVFDDNISKAEVIWNKENICNILNKQSDVILDLEKEKYELIKFVTNGKRISYHEMIELQNENEQLKQKIKFLKEQQDEWIDGVSEIMTNKIEKFI